MSSSIIWDLLTSVSPSFAKQENTKQRQYANTAVSTSNDLLLWYLVGRFGYSLSRLCELLITIQCFFFMLKVSAAPVAHWFSVWYKIRNFTFTHKFQAIQFDNHATIGFPIPHACLLRPYSYCNPSQRKSYSTSFYRQTPHRSSPYQRNLHSRHQSPQGSLSHT